MDNLVRTTLRAAGVGRALGQARYIGRWVTDSAFRRSQQRALRDYLDWRRHAEALREPLYSPGSTKRALIVAKGTLKHTQIELGLIKGLELGDFVPVVLTNRTDLQKYYRLAGVDAFLRWDAFREPAVLDQAAAIVSRAEAIEDLIPVEHAGARVGKFALSSTFRSLRVGRLDWSRPETRQAVTAHLAAGMARAAVSQQIVDAVKPDIALFLGNRYTGQGELMDVCLARGVDVLTWYDSHRSSSLMLKRYRMANRDRHHGSISDESWNRLRQMPWTASGQEALRRELHDSYAAGDWYKRGGTQVNKSIVSVDRLRARLGLDPAKKTAVIFPHIVWDATLFWGTDLFSNYEDWLVETVRAACANARVNWVIKVHPAHVAKAAAEGTDEEPAELVAIRERVGALPAHVVVIPPDTDINTYSLFPLMDYCLTVRGTIGIEAACFGIPVLTAGTGRYDHRGFTIDSDTREAFLARVAAIDALPPMTADQRELAERFAYGAFVLRPLPLTTMTIEHESDREATMRVRINARDADDLRRGPDLQALGAWAANGHQEDFMWDAAAGDDA